MKSKALIAMSGGVDSSVAAYLMRERGYDCIGVTMKLYSNEDAGVERSRTHGAWRIISVCRTMCSISAEISAAR